MMIYVQSELWVGKDQFVGTGYLSTDGTPIKILMSTIDDMRFLTIGEGKDRKVYTFDLPKFQGMEEAIRQNKNGKFNLNTLSGECVQFSGNGISVFAKGNRGISISGNASVGVIAPGDETTIIMGGIHFR